VTFGAWVTLEDEDGATVHYQLVGADEFDVSLGKISVASPVGKALLGKEEGDDVVVERPRGRAVFHDHGDQLQAARRRPTATH
jgi:transcription elongation factor GreB